MKIELVHEKKVKISLNYNDLLSADTTFEDLDYKKEKTKALISSLLKQALEQTGFDISKGRLLIEAAPLPDGGCQIYFTNIENETKSYEQPLNTPPYIFEFDSIDSMLRVIPIVKQWTNTEFQSSFLYTLKGKYLLVFYPAPGFEGRAGSILSQYGKLIGKGETPAAYVDRHGTLIYESNALEEMSYHFC